MPIIVSNTSPLLNLAIIDHLFLLPQQFGKIYIPNAVFCELRINENLPGSNSLKIAYEQGWLKVKPIDNTTLFNLLRQTLHPAESEAIALALELNADRILLDEMEARQVARSLNLKITGVLGILLKATNDGSISSIQEAIDRLQNEANFRISPRLYAQILEGQQ